MQDVTLSSQCIEGEGRKNAPNGYRQRAVRVGPGKAYLMFQHRMAFEQAWGITIPDGMLVRHTCDNSGCLNPLHLQLGTQVDNMRDMVQRGRQGIRHRRMQTHCLRGHDLSDPANLLPRRDGARACRTCHNLRARARAAARRNV
jgi:hypothetical protein